MRDHVPLPGSFRDPSGFVYEADGQMFRSLDEASWTLVRSDAWSTFSNRLATEGKLVAFTVAENVFSMERLPWITYPYEWSPKQLRTAALLTLEIQLAALDNGFSLKDASAFNVQFIGPKPIFIDHLSIEPDPGTPWVAYRQFIEHFYAPLVLAEAVSAKLPWQGVHGIGVSEASAILGKRGRWSLPIQIHIHQLAKRIQPGEASDPRALPAQPLNHRKAILIQLQQAITAMKLETPGTNWGEYYATTNYAPDQLGEKEKMVIDWLEEVKPSRLADLGANDGKFSGIAAAKGIMALAIEFDLEIVNRTFQDQPFTFIRADLTAPSEGRGWMNREREPLLKRAQSDAVLALAIIHHLVFSGQIPLAQVVEMIASVAPNAMIEWIEPDDSYVQRIIGGRTSGLQAYSKEIFEAALATHYRKFEPKPIPGTKRVLYLCQR